MRKQTIRNIRKTLAISLLVTFVMSLTGISLTASTQDKTARRKNHVFYS